MNVRSDAWIIQIATGCPTQSFAPLLLLTVPNDATSAKPATGH